MKTEISRTFLLFCLMEFIQEYSDIIALCSYMNCGVHRTLQHSPGWYLLLIVLGIIIC